MSNYYDEEMAATGGIILILVFILILNIYIAEAIFLDKIMLNK